MGSMAEGVGVVFDEKAKALFTRNARVCICIKCQEWGQWQQAMMFTLNMCIFKKWTMKTTEKRKGRRYVQMYLQTQTVLGEVPDHI